MGLNFNISKIIIIIFNFIIIITIVIIIVNSIFLNSAKIYGKRHSFSTVHTNAVIKRFFTDNIWLFSGRWPMQYAVLGFCIGPAARLESSADMDFYGKKRYNKNTELWQFIKLFMAGWKNPVQGTYAADRKNKQ